MTAIPSPTLYNTLKQGTATCGPRDKPGSEQLFNGPGPSGIFATTKKEKSRNKEKNDKKQKSSGFVYAFSKVFTS